jgi:cobalt/nickel transport system permease protein
LGKKGSPRKAGGFIDRTLLGVVSLLKETISNDELASKKGFLQGCDPRLKSLSIALLLVCVLSTKNILVLSFIYSMTLVLSSLSGIQLLFFLKRTLLFIPIFSLFIVVPAVFNVVTPGEPVISFNLFSHILSITRQGIDSAVIFFMRVLSSVSLAVLLVLTTRHHVLLKVLRIFKVPQIFVMTMGMTYRYIYLLLDIVQNTFIAIKSRVGFVTSTRTGRRVAAANMAGLWLKSYRLQTQVYNAMLARGYTGEPQVLDDFRARTIDFVVLALTIICFLGTIWLNRFTN